MTKLKPGSPPSMNAGSLSVLQLLGSRPVPAEEPSAEVIPLPGCLSFDEIKRTVREFDVAMLEAMEADELVVCLDLVPIEHDPYAAHVVTAGDSSFWVPDQDNPYIALLPKALNLLQIDATGAELKHNPLAAMDFTT